jgi:REP element-mobilizing transposase RayT
MADTYTKIYIHVVFAVRNRHPLINASWEDELYKYITGIIRNKGQLLIAINGTRDHIHLLIGMKPDCALSDLVREIKKSSNKFIRDNNYLGSNFRWQAGFGAFSCGYDQLELVARYILQQKVHHQCVSQKEEYVKMLEQHAVRYKEEYL